MKIAAGYTHPLAFLLLVAASLSLTWSLVNFAQDVKTLLNLRHRKKSTSNSVPLESYSFIGGDHPKRLPVEEKLVKMIAEESVHYSLTEPEAKAEWLWTASMGDGHIRIGKEKRMFAVAMFHQLHCLRTIRIVMENGWDSITHTRQGHILHCFNYIRQYTLCSADVTLEPGDFTKRNFTTQRAGATHTCIDWLPVYKMMEKKWSEWEDFRIAHGIPAHDEVT